jgi:hypothetical protein
MKIDNKHKENYYKFLGKGPDETDIYVTGSHMIFSKNDNKFIEVNNHSDAVSTEEIAPFFFSLITDDHKIKIGECEFWDWEDDILKI